MLINDMTASANKAPNERVYAQYRIAPTKRLIVRVNEDLPAGRQLPLTQASVDQLLKKHHTYVAQLERPDPYEVQRQLGEYVVAMLTNRSDRDSRIERYSKLPLREVTPPQIDEARVLRGAVAVFTRLWLDQDPEKDPFFVAKNHKVETVSTGGHSDWLARAECHQESIDPEIFFPGDGIPRVIPPEVAKICMRCEVREECLSSAIANKEAFGIWGGKTPGERRRFVRRMKQR